jgi:hypothetical protein
MHIYNVTKNKGDKRQPVGANIGARAGCLLLLYDSKVITWSRSVDIRVTCPWQL